MPAGDRSVRAFACGGPSSDVLMERFPREVGAVVKLLSWHWAWHAANAMKGYSDDAAKAKVASPARCRCIAALP